MTASRADTVLSLAARSLVTTAGGDRYRLLFPIREFARRELLETGELAGAENRHDSWVVKLTERLLMPWVRHSASAAAELWAERDSCWAAIDRLEERDPDAMVTVAIGFPDALFRRIPAAMIDQLLWRAIRVARPDHPHADLLQLAAAVAAGNVGDPARRATHAGIALELADSGGNRFVAARALLLLAYAEIATGNEAPGSNRCAAALSRSCLTTTGGSGRRSRTPGGGTCTGVASSLPARNMPGSRWR